MTEMEKMGARAKNAASVLAVAGKKKKTALLAIADALVANKERIIEKLFLLHYKWRVRRKVRRKEHSVWSQKTLIW